MLSVLAQAAVIAPVSFAIGVVVGVRIQQRKLTREVIVQARGLKAWLDRWLMLFVGGFMIVVSVLVWNGQRQHNGDVAALKAQSGQTQALTMRVQHLTACVARFDNQLSESLHPRQAAAKKLQTADNAFNAAFLVVLNDVFFPPATAQGKADLLHLKAAAAAKKSVAEHLNHERAVNPYPPPPKKVCPK